jgi:hypothetical protein
MIVPVDDILKLISEDLSGLRFIPICNIEIKSSEKKKELFWAKGKVIPKDQILEVKQQGVKEIDLYYTHSLNEYLCTFCPDHFRVPAAVKTFIEIDKIINTFEAINRTTKRKRSISILKEIYDRANDLDPIIRYNEALDFRKWNLLKRDIKKDSNIPILFNEIGIIIFVDLTRKRGNYIDKFKKNADLCALLTLRKSDNYEFQICPEFNAMIDIWAVNDPNKLLETYIEKSPRLIIVGDTIDEKYKSALIEIKRYDKYARFVVVNDIDPAGSKNLLEKIKKIYNTDSFQFE